jgi:hypothetical protein
MSYDRVDWHYGNDYPDNLPPENGGTHIGMFLAWAINNGLVGLLHLQNSGISLEKVRKKQMTGREFLLEECDEKFWDEDLNEEGNAFAKSYYEPYVYFSDYEKTFDKYPTLYHVEDTWENYEKIAQVITSRYRKWKSSSEKMWWQFWK